MPVRSIGGGGVEVFSTLPVAGVLENKKAPVFRGSF